MSIIISREKMKNILNFWDKKLFRQISYFLFIILAVLLLGYLGNQIFHIDSFLESYELKTYDLRLQAADKNNHKAENINKDIVIISIDNASLDFLESELGRWPWSRDVYADTIDYLSKDGARLINFDLMFVGYQKGFEDKDLKLAEAVSKHDNVYVSMSFDIRSDAKNPPDLPQALKVKVENKSKTANFDYGFNYSNLIMDKILNNTKNIGIINFLRDEDNVSRRSPTFFDYNGSTYPYMPLKLASDYIVKNEKVNIDKYVINEKNQLVFGNRKIQLDEYGSMIINWYGGLSTFKYVPFWKIYKSIENERKGLPPVLDKNFFKNKIIFIGATATSLYDIKSTPLSRIYPGVEVQATVFNNILDNNIIERVSAPANFGICILLAFLIGIAVIKIREPIISTVTSVIILAAYFGFATYMLNRHNLWFDVLPQTAFALMTFTFMFIVKYVLKSKDFEYTYKLATTDGLTNLFNHRYFQEHLTKSMKKCDKTGERFSLVLIDIDHFKKFNDTYGHQAGDEVLRQVGQTLRKAVKAHDLVARYGGEEMVIVLDKAHSEAALKIANRICKTVADRPFELSEGLTVNVTISLGVATYPIDGTTSAELIEFADQGLYRAKKNGRNQVGALPEIKFIVAE
jgi:diguanylate cyclase (GGDEF)-like protein